MILRELIIHQLRNIVNARLTFDDRFNLILGPNGSGKTSVLEAVYMLSCGHSFRARETTPLITYNQNELTIFGRSSDDRSISMKKSMASPTVLKINQEFCKSTSELAANLPALVMYSDAFEIINSGSSERRSVLDWGVFHVEHSYAALMKQYKQVLKQRNALLRKRASYEQFIPWDTQLSHLAQQIHASRLDYFNRLNAAFQLIMPRLATIACSLSYYKGWDKKNAGITLLDALKDGFDSDLVRGYTQQGAHHADIHITTNESLAKQGLSRGQQKMVLYAIRFAQGSLLSLDPVYLFDDFFAELDSIHLDNLLCLMENTKGQFIMTSTFVPANERIECVKTIPMDTVVKALL